jgi:phage-related baseplate assembly protein
VAAPTRVPFTLEANLTIFSTAESAMVQTAALASANAYIADRRAGLGRDLVASQAIKALSVEGVYKVELVSWADRILAASEWADGLAVLHMVGSANG